MPSWSFLEIGTTLQAFLVFSLFMGVSGYVAGWLGNVCGFRGGSLPRKIALSIALSIAVTPIEIYLPWRFLSIRAVWAVLAVVATAFVVIVVIDLQGADAAPRAESRRAAWIVGILAVGAWLLVGLV